MTTLSSVVFAVLVLLGSVVVEARQRLGVATCGITFRASTGNDSEQMLRLGSGGSAVSPSTSSSMLLLLLSPSNRCCRGCVSQAAITNTASSFAFIQQSQLVQARRRCYNSHITFHTNTAKTTVTNQQLSRFHDDTSRNYYTGGFASIQTKPWWGRRPQATALATRLFASYEDGNQNAGGGNGNDNNDDENWTVPDYIDVPFDQLEVSYVRSSGAGGQNVNKLNTQVQVRFHVASASWIGPYEVRQRLMQQQASRVNKDGYLVLHVQDHRTQTQNKDLAVKRLRTMILEAWPRPKIRKQRKGLSKKTKEQRKEFKRKRAQVKESRRRVTDF